MENNFFEFNKQNVIFITDNNNKQKSIDVVVTDDDNVKIIHKRILSCNNFNKDIQPIDNNNL